MKVFANVRAKDLCYQYNSNIMKGATMALRPTLAAGVINTCKEEDRSMPVCPSMTNLSTKLMKVRVRVEKKLQKKRCQARLPKLMKKKMGLGKEANESNVEPDIIDEPVISTSVQHNELQKRANQDLDADESYQNLCTIDKDAENYMGKSIH